ncbi:hypothetical protein MMC22_001558 [Lobaria immixta]|nr:hypothetical protein [Lobaria immixta]
MLAQYCSSSPAFLNLALELGFKISDTEENCGTLYYRLHSSDKDCQIESYEITYSVRYIEEHGRDELIDPWSLRHVVVHQRYFFTKNLSTWVVIQVPSSIRGQLERAISAAGSIGRLPATAGPHPMALHALFLISSQRHWDAYIKYLFEQHAEMSDVARFSSVGRQHKRDYALDFSNCQLLETLRSKIRRATVTLDAHSNNIKSFTRLLQSTSSLPSSAPQFSHPSQHELEAELQQHIHKTITQKKRLKMLLESSASTSKLLFQILSHRHASLVQSNIFSLTNFASIAADESKAMLGVTQSAQIDSRAMRNASLIALAYLPATLIATIFSSNLVQFPGGSAESGSGARFHREVAIFVVITGVLTIFTFGIAYLWGLRVERRERANNASNRLFNNTQTT